ncbi:hypothetical protein ACH5RR_040923 [Cinchona calisaya]|uniref:Uncharacterized protein n=1 Tax=Cinchona calisaya TaxID=153742 RepID=A0ABD2XUN6_9GENT
MNSAGRGDFRPGPLVEPGAVSLSQINNKLLPSPQPTPTHPTPQEMFPRNQDSDQSLSEEDLSCDSSEKCATSLSGPLEHKGSGMQVLSQLEKLRKAYELDDGNNTTIPSKERRKALCIEDEIEFPAFHNEVDSIGHLGTTSVLDSDEENTHDQRFACICNSDEEIMSDDQGSNLPTIGSVKRYKQIDTWSEANREVEALFQLNENTGPSKVHKSSKDSRSKPKPRFLFRFQSQKQDCALLVSDKNEIGMSPIDLPHSKESDGGEHVDLQKSMDESLESFKGREEEQPRNYPVPFELAIHHDCNDNSVAEFLDSLQEKSGWLRGSCEMPNTLTGKERQVAVRRTASAIGDRNIHKDILLYGGSSTNNKGAFLHPKPVLQQKTIADQFHEALGAVSPKNVISEVKFYRKSGSGLFEKLQHVIQNEKERDIDFLESSNMDAISRDGRSCIDVRILSRSVEAKLTVCCCSLIQDEENSQLVNNLHMRKQIEERTLTIIFTSRICGHIELEVGNLIRIQPPWKEVIIEKDAVIILSTYFVQRGS